MSESTTDESAPAAEVPAEVEAMDGIADETEAHNAERPTRGSGIHKHTKKPKGKELSEFKVGDSIEGKVKSITSYGAFVDIGANTDALLHVSRLSDDFVSNVEDIVKSGDDVTVRIASIDAEKKQISLTMRSEEAEAKASEQAAARASGKGRQRPRRSEGDRAAQRETMAKLAEASISDETFVEGEVVSILDFGAFVRFDTSPLAEGLTGEVDGLVHISALTPGRASSVDSVVKVGDKVQVRVKTVDAEGGKVSLSMISKEDESKAQSAAAERSAGRRRKSQWSDAEMGPKDWKEQMERVLADQPEFKNMPVIVDKRK